MLKRTLFSLSIIITAINANAVELMDYQQREPGNFTGIVPVQINDQNGSVSVTVTGAEKLLDFKLQKKQYGLDILLADYSTTVDTGFVVDIKSALESDSRAYSVIAAPQPVSLQATQMQPSLTEQRTMLAPIVTPTKLHRVKAGETVTKIARQYKQLGGIFSQRAVALILLNPLAFENGNINHLKKHYDLVLPALSQIQSLNPNETLKYFHKRMNNLPTTSLFSLQAASPVTISQAEPRSVVSEVSPVDRSKPFPIERLRALESFQNKQVAVNRANSAKDTKIDSRMDRIDDSITTLESNVSALTETIVAMQKQLFSLTEPSTNK